MEESVSNEEKVDDALDQIFEILDDLDMPVEMAFAIGLAVATRAFELAAKDEVTLQ